MDRRFVFVCYAREDKLAAERLYNDLKAAEIDAWMDEGSLRGGDEWKAQIKRAINSCTHFIPIISRNTVARGEGFFRYEWDIAVERMRAMASDMNFVVPVSIDETSANDSARVPAAFLGAHWRRLRNGATTPTFVSELKKSLGISDAQKTVGSEEISKAEKERCKLINISSRVRVSPDSTPIFGFVLSNGEEGLFLLRAIGPALLRFGVAESLPDPVLTVFRGGTVVATNERWDSVSSASTRIRAAADSVGAISLAENNADAAILLALSAGSYTVHIASKSQASGLVLFELYQLGATSA